METQLARDLIAEWEEKTDRASRIEILEDIFHLYSKEDFEAPPDPVGHLTVGPNGEVYRRLASGKYKVERARHR